MVRRRRPFHADRGAETRRQRRAGTRLEWRADVVPALWRTAFTEPVLELVERVNDPATTDDTVRRIAQVRQRESPDGGHSLQPDRVILETPTFHAWLAAQSMPEGNVTSPFTLPAPASYEVEHFGDVMAVLHRHGVTFYDSAAGSSASLHLRLLAERVAAASAAYDGFLREYPGKLSDWTAELLDASDEPNGGREKADKHSGKTAHRTRQKRNLTQWAEDMIRTKAAALAALGDTTLLEADYDHNRLAEKLQRMWGLSEQRADLLELIDRVDELMRQVIAARTERRQRIYGSLLSAAGLGIAASHIWEPVKGYLTTALSS